MFYVVNGNLDWESRNYIRNNFNSVFIANGNENINSSIVNDLRNSGLRVNQIYGNDSFDLSMKISENSNEFYTTLHSVYLTSGRNVADGVPGSVLAAKSGMPLMLVDGNNNKNEIASYINKKNVDRVYILGGRNSVPTEVENAINNTGGGTNPISKKREAIVNLTMQQLGKRYSWGAVGPNTFDCSGLVYYVYKNALSMNISRTSKAQSKLGKQISKDYTGKELVAIGLLRGSFVFLADLVREIDNPIVVDFITTSSYEHSEISTGTVNILSDLRENIEGKDVLIVDDIMDSGNTLKNIREYILTKNPNSVKTCVMLDKPCRREVDLVPDYFGFEIEDWFIVGYGLNYGNKYRNIPYIFSYED